MGTCITTVAVLVKDYDEALAFYVGKLGFRVLEDTPLSAGKRWVRIAAPSYAAANDAQLGVGAGLLLAKAASPEQQARVGDQTGGRVFLFLESDDFDRDYQRMQTAGVKFLEAPRNEAYGTVVVFEDLYGNRWDLLQTTFAHAGTDAQHE